jgi:uncharacterized protein YprB with RNaseH-like and TPR domain
MIPEYMKGLTNRANATNKQYEYLYSHRCDHRHRYSTHFNCFLKENGISERIGFIDIETSNLKANFGVMLCWCIGDEKGKIYEDYMTHKDVASGKEDTRITENCIATMLKFDRLVGHYSTYFDIPFIRTRALIQGLKFPPIGSIYHTDVWKMARSKLCLHSNRQDVVAESLQGKTVKTRISHPAWREAMMGNEKAAQLVLDHCRKDIVDLKKNFDALLPF